MRKLSTLAVLMALAAAPAQSQNAAESTDLEEVVVTGIRQQLETSQARKENAEEILASITAADIGALPDRSVTEVLQRYDNIGLTYHNWVSSDRRYSVFVRASF